MLDGEKDIIERAIKGEAEAFGLLYDHYQPKIYRFILIKVSHREEAEDLTHQVFLNAWEKIPGYVFQGFPFSSWLYRIAKNKIIDHYRTQKINIDIESAEGLKTDNPSLETLDKNIDIEKVMVAIKRLNQEYQNVIILRFVEDLPIKEVSKILNKSEMAIKLIQYRAIKKLKTMV